MFDAIVPNTFAAVTFMTSPAFGHPVILVNVSLTAEVT